MQNAGTNAQSKLFPEVDAHTVYEQPLNERMRNVLRLEYLFQGIADCLERDTIWDARAAIINMIEITDLIGRVDIKGELIKEIERHAAILSSLRSNPSVNQNTLEKTLAAIEPIAQALKLNSCQPGSKLRQNELVSQIKQRIAIPGGTCNFDLPAFHYWLSRSADVRTAQLEEWLQDLKIIEDATRTVLKLVRDSAVPRRVSAPAGFYQQQLDGNLPCQLVRVIIADSETVFPEISGGKHRFTVRFFRQPSTNSRPQQAPDTVWFELQCCGI